MGHVHQPGVGHGDDGVGAGLVYLIYIESCSGNMTSNLNDDNAEHQRMLCVVRPEITINVHDTCYCSWRVHI